MFDTDDLIELSDEPAHDPPLCGPFVAVMLCAAVEFIIVVASVVTWRSYHR